MWNSYSLTSGDMLMGEISPLSSAGGTADLPLLLPAALLSVLLEGLSCLTSLVPSRGVGVGDAPASLLPGRLVELLGAEGLGFDPILDASCSPSSSKPAANRQSMPTGCKYRLHHSKFAQFGCWVVARRVQCSRCERVI